MLANNTKPRYFPKSLPKLVASIVKAICNQTNISFNTSPCKPCFPQGFQRAVKWLSIFPLVNLQRLRTGMDPGFYEERCESSRGGCTPHSRTLLIPQGRQTTLNQVRIFPIPSFSYHIPQLEDISMPQKKSLFLYLYLRHPKYPKHTCRTI